MLFSVRDALITHKHASEINDFNLTVFTTTKLASLLKIGVPLTISTISKSYVIKEWLNMSYKGYQIQHRSDLIVGNLASVLTPKGARAVYLTNFIVPFIACYRGGRNESYMYGVDVIKDKRVWIDYDLISCYTTVMSILGHPDYDKAVRLLNKTVKGMKDVDLLLNYVVVDV